MQPTILKLDISGLPVGWITWQTAAVLYSRERVRWEAGDTRFTFTGGVRGDGLRSSVSISSIIAVPDKSGRYMKRAPPPLTNRALFQRDGVCLYCGERYPASKLTMDHVIPKSRGGETSWTNAATACKPCNTAKNDRLLSETSMSLLAVPFVPDPAAYLLLIASGRRITACQQSWLESFAAKGKKLS